MPRSLEKPDELQPDHGLAFIFALPLDLEQDHHGDPVHRA